MKGFELQLWHQLAILFTLLVGVFKSEISNCLYGLVSIWEKNHSKGQRVEILSDSGVWEEVTIVSFNYALPFTKKHGGVVIHHKSGDGVVYLEKLSFRQWKSLRIRYTQVSPQQVNMRKTDTEHV